MAGVLVLLLLALVVGVGVLAFGGYTGGTTLRRRTIIEREPLVEREVAYARPARRRRIIEEDLPADY